MPTHRLFYVVGELSGGGLERQLWYLLSAMDRKQYMPGVAVWHYDPGEPIAERLQNLGIPIYPINPQGNILSKLVYFRDLIRIVEPEVLHSYSLYTNFAAWWAMRNQKGIAIGSLRNDYWAMFGMPGLKTNRTQYDYWQGSGFRDHVIGFLSSVLPDRLISNNERAQQAALAHHLWGVPRKVKFVPNAIELSEYQVAPFPQVKCFEIVGIGRLYHQKRWDIALQALKIFSAKTKNQWRFRICGIGPLLEELQQLCKTLSLNENVEFLGFRTDVPSILASSHVLLLTSAYEGTPNVVMEAMAIGRPIIATAVGDLPRLINDGIEGFLVSVEDADTIADRLLQLSGNIPLAESMGKAAREKVEQEANPEKLVEKTLVSYHHLGWPK